MKSGVCVRRGRRVTWRRGSVEESARRVCRSVTRAGWRIMKNKEIQRSLVCVAYASEWKGDIRRETREERRCKKYRRKQEGAGGHEYL